MPPSSDDSVPTDRSLLSGFRGPAHTRAIIGALRRLPVGMSAPILSTLAVADGVLRRGRYREATRWATAQGRRGWAARRLALELLANHGRFVAQEALLGVSSLDDLRQTTTIHGLEHLDQLQSGAILLGFHLGPPRAWLALRAYGYPVRFACRMDAGRGAEWEDLVAREIVVPMPGHEFEGRVQAMYRLNRLLNSGALVYLAADGPLGREAFRNDLPGGPHIVRTGWLTLRRQLRVPTIPVLTHMNGSRRVIEVLQPLPPPESDSALDAEMCRRTLEPLLADYVRRFPEQCRYLAFPPWSSVGDRR